MSQPRVVVYGGRDYSNVVRLFGVLDHYHRESGGFAVVIEGEADGVDKLARAWAESRGVPFLPFPADWDDLTTPPVVLRHRRDGTSYNAAAGGTRNQRMIDEGKPDVGIEFPGGRGTADMHKRLAKAIGADRIVQVPGA